MKKCSEVGSRAIRKRIAKQFAKQTARGQIRKRIAKQFAKQTARVVKHRASQAGSADRRARVPSHWDGRVLVSTRSWPLQTAEHPKGARPPARPGVLLLAATAVACS